MKKLLFIALVLTFATAYGNPRKALKLLEKKKFDKALVVLQKSIEKDSLNPGANYLLSRLYLDTAYISYDEDLAWHYMLVAERQYAQADDKVKKSLAKAAIDHSVLKEHKAKIDSTVFAAALAINTIHGYNRFIFSHPEAIQAPEAKERRNHLAWAETKRENTWQAYASFMKTYPDASQFREAEELYEVLLYEEKTENNNLTSYIRFLEEFPQTPYRNEAEKKIFELGAAGTHASGFLWFLKNYPDSYLRNRAVNYLYHLYKETHDPDDFYNDYAFAGSDSLQSVTALERFILAPFLEEDHFGFVDASWNVMLQPVFDSIPAGYLCGNIASDFICAVRDGRPMIIGRNGAVIYEGEFDNVEDTGHGFLKIYRNGLAAMWHKAGFPVLDFGYEDFGILDKKFIIFKKDGRWGVATFTGIIILENEFDEILSVGGFVFLKKGNYFSVTNADQILLALEHKMPAPEFYLDDAEALEGGYLIGYRHGKETLIDKSLRTLIPLGDHQIIRMKQGWMLKRETGFQTLTAELTPVFECTRADYNDQWFSLKKEGKWAFLADDTTFAEGFVYDSALLVGKSFAYLERDGQALVFINGTQRILPEGADIRLIKPAIWRTGEMASEYLLVSEKNKKTIYDIAGQAVLEGTYERVTPLGNEYFVLESSGRKGLADSQGNILIKPAYEAIGNYNNGYVSLLKSKKFGVYNLQKNVHIEPQYETMLRPLGDSLLLARVKGQWGVVDAQNKPLTRFEFMEIRTWNDSLLLAQGQDRFYSLVDLKTGLPVYGGIESYKTLREDAEDRVIQILKKSQYGILSATRGELVAPAFSDIVNIGSVEKPLYFAQKTIREAGYIVVVYYGSDGTILKRQAFTEEEFDRIYCE